MRLPTRPRVENLEDRATPATFTVTSLADSGAGTLRAAIAQAQADAVADTIVFDPSVRGGTVNLTAFDTGLDPTEFGPSAFIITTPVAIQGSGETIRRATGSASFRLFSVLSAGGNGKLSVTDVELSGGFSRGGDGGGNGAGGGGGLGGAIFNAGQLTLRRVTVSGNTAQGGNGSVHVDFATGGGGGGVGGPGTGVNGGGPNGGVVGTPNGGVGGGGLGTFTGTPGNGGFGGGAGGTEYGSPATGGFGGGGGNGGFGRTSGAGGFGAAAGGGVGAARSGGGGAGLGGGVFNNGGTVTVESCTFSGNAAGGGTGGAAAAQGLGGGLFNHNGTVGILLSTFTANVAATGRQVYALGNGGTANTTVNATILAQADTAASDFFGQAVAGGTNTTAGAGNLIRTAVGFAGGVTVTADPLLGPLAKNGGPTRTHLPQAGSPVVNALAASAAGGVTTDQRGQARVAGGNLDIGAVEIQSLALTPLEPAPIPVVPPPPLIALFPAYIVGVGNAVQVRSQTHETMATLSCFAESFTGGVRVAFADVNGDGFKDVIAAAGPGGDPHVKVFDGTSSRLLASFYAFAQGFTGGVSVAAGDVTGDGLAEIVVGAGPGGDPHVRVLRVNPNSPEPDELASFYSREPSSFAPNALITGVSVAVGGGQIFTANVLGQKSSARPTTTRIVTYSLRMTDPDKYEASEDKFSAELFDTSRDGLRLVDPKSGLEVGNINPAYVERSMAVADFDGDGILDCLVGSGRGNTSPQLLSLRPTSSAFPHWVQHSSQPAYKTPDFTGGVRVGAADLDGDGLSDVLTGAGVDGGPHVIASNGRTGQMTASFYAREALFLGGVWVA